MFRHTALMEAKDRSGNLPNITQVRRRSMEMLGNLPYVTELRYGRTERSGNLPNITHCSKVEAQRFQATFLKITQPQKKKHTEVKQLA